MRQENMKYFKIFFQDEYAFDVFRVDSCPLSKEDWQIRSNQLKCNSSHGYHCVPNKHLTSLIEFCYPKGARIPFEEGNIQQKAQLADPYA